MLAGAMDGGARCRRGRAADVRRALSDLGTVVANKPVGACLGGIIGLIYVQQAFPYEDHDSMLKGATDAKRSLEERRLSASLYGALAVKRGLIIAAFVIAVASAF